MKKVSIICFSLNHGMRTFLFLVVAFLGIGCCSGTAISPVEIAEARQRCTTQCAHPNHKEAAACMRKCWATFFAQRKTQRTVARPMPAVASKSRSVAHKKAAVLPSKGRSVGKPKLVRPHFKGRSTTKKGVAPFAHGRHVRSAAAQLAGLGVFLIALIFVII